MRLDWTGYDHPDRGRTDPGNPGPAPAEGAGNPLAARPGEPTMDQEAAARSRASVQLGERTLLLLKSGDYRAAVGALVQSVARATQHMSDEQAAGVIRAFRPPSADPAAPQPFAGTGTGTKAAPPVPVERPGTGYARDAIAAAEASQSAVADAIAWGAGLTAQAGDDMRGYRDPAQALPDAGPVAILPRLGHGGRESSNVEFAGKGGVVIGNSDWAAAGSEEGHPTGPATPEPTTADRAREGLQVLAHPLAWQPGAQ